MPGQAHAEAAREAILTAKSPEAIREALETGGSKGAEERFDLASLLLHPFNVTDRTVSPQRAGRFVSEIPTDAVRMEMAAMRATLLRGASWHSLTDDEQELIDAHVLCTWCLKERPDWYTDTLGARLPMVTLSVGRVIREHHAQFFRQHHDAAGASEGRPLVEITPLVGT
jgi:hypothetical protein